MTDTQPGGIRPMCLPSGNSRTAKWKVPAPGSWPMRLTRSVNKCLRRSVLRDFLPGAGALTLDDRRRLVEQAIVLLDQIYVHLTLESAMQAVNPVQRLRLLRRRLEHQADVNDVPEWRFHQEMSSIFHSVRDLHTNYLLPTTTPDVADGPVDISVVASGGRVRIEGFSSGVLVAARRLAMA